MRASAPLAAIGLIGLAAAAGAAAGVLSGPVIALLFLGLAGAALAVGTRRSARAPPSPAVPNIASPALAQAIVAQLPDPVILVDAGSNVIDVNAAARSWLPGLAVGKALSYALRSPDILDGVAHVLAGGGAREVHYTERVPTERSFESRIVPLPLEGGAGGAILFFRDITAVRRTEQMRVDFVANASHELRTPLASVLGFVETLQGPARDDPAARERFLEIMRGQAERMRRLVDDLLSLSRIEQREHVAPTTPVDLRATVQEVLEPLRRLAAKGNVEIRLTASEGATVVLGDRDELIRLIENLVENAVKYGESGKVVDLAVSGGERVELSVRDYGPGIAEEDRPRLTERFYRVNLAESRAKGGTGLGLAIVKHIVNRHRGTLSIESELGQGALFRAVFPSAPSGRASSE